MNLIYGQQPAQTGLFPPAAEEGWGGTVVGSEAFAWQLEVVPRLSVTPDQVGQALVEGEATADRKQQHGHDQRPEVDLLAVTELVERIRRLT